MTTGLVITDPQNDFLSRVTQSDPPLLQTKEPHMRTLLSKLTPGQDETATMQALWNGAVIAQSDDTVVVEGNHYFPLESVNPDVLQASSHKSLCPWKGMASYYDVVADGNVNSNAAWYYPHPTPPARKVTGRIAFWNGVTVRPLG